MSRYDEFQATPVVSSGQAHSELLGVLTDDRHDRCLAAMGTHKSDRVRGLSSPGESQIAHIVCQYTAEVDQDASKLLVIGKPDRRSSRAK